MGAFLFEAPFFFPLRDASQVKRNLPTQWPECKSVCVCLLLCEQCMFHYQTLFSVLNGTFFFFFWCGLEKLFQGKAGSIAFVFAPLFGWSLRHSAQGSALFLPPGLGTLLRGSVGNEASIICDLPLSRSSLH